MQFRGLSSSPQKPTFSWSESVQHLKDISLRFRLKVSTFLMRVSNFCHAHGSVSVFNIVKNTNRESSWYMIFVIFSFIFLTSVYSSQHIFFLTSGNLSFSLKSQRLKFLFIQQAKYLFAVFLNYQLFQINLLINS